jgi:hypothetical protein
MSSMFHANGPLRITHRGGAGPPSGCASLELLAKVGPVEWKMMVAIGSAVGAVVWLVERRRNPPPPTTDRWAQVTDPVQPA